MNSWFLPHFLILYNYKEIKNNIFPNMRSFMCTVKGKNGARSVLLPALWHWHCQELGIWSHWQWSETWAAGTDKTESDTLASWSVREDSDRERVNIGLEEEWKRVKTGELEENAYATENMSVRIKVLFPLFQPDISRLVFIVNKSGFSSVKLHSLVTTSHNYNYEFALK